MDAHDWGHTLIDVADGRTRRTRSRSAIVFAAVLLIAVAAAGPWTSRLAPRGTGHHRYVCLTAGAIVQPRAVPWR
jgi:hypothetical protein